MNAMQWFMLIVIECVQNNMILYCDFMLYVVTGTRWSTPKTTQETDGVGQRRSTE